MGRGENRPATAEFLGVSGMPYETRRYVQALVRAFKGRGELRDKPPLTRSRARNPDNPEP
ncbi:hypothetical protein GCM10010276_43310 [Streptomyces longisporus]|uniref:Uncharacterized protein n=1 Tax=Streptomyces longisporus TaxID=1948 RepID=A0ABN3MA77_STRLO